MRSSGPLLSSHVQQLISFFIHHLRDKTSNIHPLLVWLWTIIVPMILFATVETSDLRSVNVHRFTVTSKCNPSTRLSFSSRCLMRGVLWGDVWRGWRMS